MVFKFISLFIVKNFNYRYIEILQFFVYDSKYYIEYWYNNLIVK